MSTNTSITTNQILINHAKTSWLIRAILTLVFLICGMTPILWTYFMFSNAEEFHIGIFISYFIFGLLGFLMLRIVLWNTFGKEIISLSQDKITYIADYKYFKDGQKELATDKLQVEIIYEDTTSVNVGRLRIFNPEGEIETVLKSSLTDLESIKNKIITYYSTTIKAHNNLA